MENLDIGKEIKEGVKNLFYQTVHYHDDPQMVERYKAHDFFHLKINEIPNFKGHIEYMRNIGVNTVLICDRSRIYSTCKIFKFNAHGGSKLIKEFKKNHFDEYRTIGFKNTSVVLLFQNFATVVGGGLFSQKRPYYILLDYDRNIVIQKKRSSELLDVRDIFQLSDDLFCIVIYSSDNQILMVRIHEIKTGKILYTHKRKRLHYSYSFKDDGASMCIEDTCKVLFLGGGKFCIVEVNENNEKTISVKIIHTGSKDKFEIEKEITVEQQISSYSSVKMINQNIIGFVKNRVSSENKYDCEFQMYDIKKGKFSKIHKGLLTGIIKFKKCAPIAVVLKNDGDKLSLATYEIDVNTMTLTCSFEGKKKIQGIMEGFNDKKICFTYKFFPASKEINKFVHEKCDKFFFFVFASTNTIYSDPGSTITKFMITPQSVQEVVHVKCEAKYDPTYDHEIFIVDENSIVLKGFNKKGGNCVMFFNLRTRKKDDLFSSIKENYSGFSEVLQICTPFSIRPKFVVGRWQSCTVLNVFKHYTKKRYLLLWIWKKKNYPVDVLRHVIFLYLSILYWVENE